MFFSVCCHAESHQGEYQRKLYKELLKNYNRLERPVLNDSQPLLVELGMTLLQIIDVDEKNQVLITNAWLQLYWTDVYLTWNPEQYPGVQNLRFPSNQIWVPDILLYNSADERFDATFHTNVLVNASGACQYIPPGILKSTCYIDVRWFPFDVQKCDLKFGSWTHNGWLLDLQMLEVDISTYISNGEWDLVGVPGKRNELYYECCKEPYPDVTFTVTMRRRTLYYGLNLLIPCVLISGLALLVFLLPADSGEKISLGITVLLSLTVFMLLVAEIMPATSDSVPLIAQYFASTMMIVGLSVVVTVLVLQFHHHDPHGGKMPKWVMLFTSPVSGHNVMAERYITTLTYHLLRIELSNIYLVSGVQGSESLKHTFRGVMLIDVCHPLVSNNQEELTGKQVFPIKNSNPGPNIYFSIILFFSCQVRVVLLNWCAWFLRMKKPGEDRKLLAYKYSHPQHHSSASSIEMNAVPEDNETIHTRTLSEQVPEITKILEEVQYIARRFRDQDEGEAICSEWKFAAAVVDRLCLVAFSLFSIICTFTILMSAPNFIEAVSKDFT
ncbi:ACHA7 protein, partial [Amia calva]|nr:ACHA7 protein [Amia calva]